MTTSQSTCDDVPKTITEAAHRLGMGGTTRLYDWQRMGLVTFPRSANGRSYMTRDVWVRINAIRALRKSGLSISAIRRILDDIDNGDMEAAKQSVRDYASRARDWADRLKAMAEAIDNGADVLEAACSVGEDTN